MDARPPCFASGSNLVQRMLRFSTIASALLGVASAAAAQGTVEPWFFNSDGVPVMQPHEYDEDTGNTVYALAWDFHQPANQPTPKPDVLVLNGPLFDPPEGVPAAAGTRRLLTASIDGEFDSARRALQLYVNYSRVPIGPSQTTEYWQPTFFIPGVNKEETDPPLLTVGLGETDIAPTRAALGIVGASVTPKSRFPFWHEPTAAPLASQMNAMYVTGGIGVPFSELDGPSTTKLQESVKDRLLIRENGVWVDRSSIIPAAACNGNSSGACFADFDGDGLMDIFVGKYGDGFAGARSRLLLYREDVGGIPGNDMFVDFTSTKLPNLTLATVDVAAGDLDLDGDQDIVLANRTSLGAGPHPEAIDYYLKNNWPSAFQAVALSTSVESDTRSIALGNLDYVPGLEIVLGNAGPNTFSNTLDVPSDPLQIFRRDNPTLPFFDDVASFLGSLPETEISRPFTWQVVIADVFAPPGGHTLPKGTDGKLDLFLVNHRDILLDYNPAGEARDASNVQVLINPNLGSSTRAFLGGLRYDFHWATCLALADFTWNGDPNGNPNFGPCAAGTLDFFIGAGNSYSGVDSRYMENAGPPSGENPHTWPWPYFSGNGNLNNQLSYDAMPGNERGYGFDFADLNGDDKLEAIQTSRAYNFLTYSCGFTMGGHGFWHVPLTAAASLVQFSNARGQLFPWGAEDAVFADFDQDGGLDALLASQTGASGTHPATPETFDTVVLRGTLSPSTTEAPFLHETTTEEFVNAPGNYMTIDKYLDVGGRSHSDRPIIADRAVAVDLDNDGDDDGLVRLFPFNVSVPSVPESIPAITAMNGFLGAIDQYAAGFRYLENLVADDGYVAGDPWFLDVAPSKLHDTDGAFSTNWNRPLGFEVLADFDNNGACDLFSLVHDDAVVGQDVSTIQQSYDLLFLNDDPHGAPPVHMIGHLVESGDSWELPRRPMPLANGSFGGSGAAQGDLDNDGDADLFVTCDADDVFGALLLNRVINASNPANAGERFDDVFLNRVPIAVSEVSAAIHSPKQGTNVVDRGGMPIVVDIDGDGDLDIIYAVQRNIPRVYRNLGADTNGDGFIDASDELPFVPVGTPNTKPGWFEDVTDEYLPRIRPIVDSFDAQAADIDRDGDYDLLFDCFDDEIVPLNNDVAQSGDKPTITEAWPRVGAVRGRTVQLEGVNLDSPEEVEIRCRGTGYTHHVTTGITPAGLNRISFTLPDVPGLKGLVQIRVLQSENAPADQWTRQYFGYFIFGS